MVWNHIDSMGLELTFYKMQETAQQQGLYLVHDKMKKKIFVREIARLISFLLNDRVKKIIFLIQTLLKRSFLNSVSNSVSDSFYILLCSAGSCLLALRNDSSALLGRWLL